MAITVTDFNGEKLKAAFYLIYFIIYHIYIFKYDLYNYIVLIEYIYQWLSSKMASKFKFLGMEVKFQLPTTK